MDWILLAIAIALLVVAVYSGISYFREKKQSVVYLGDSPLFTIIPSCPHPLRGPQRVSAASSAFPAPFPVHIVKKRA